MSDDPTEQALRRALDDAARQVDVPMARLPEPSPVLDDRSPRRPTALLACLVAIVALAAGSLVVLAAGDDGTPSVQIGSSPQTGPITAAEADVYVALRLGSSLQEVDSVRAVLESDADVPAYTYLTTEQALAELRVLASCDSNGIGSIGSNDLLPQFRVLVPLEPARRALAEQLATMQGVVEVRTMPHGELPRGGSDATSGTSSPTTTAASGTTPTTTPAATTVPSPTTSVVSATTSVSTAADSTDVVEVQGGPTTTAVTGAPTTEPPTSTTLTTNAAPKEIPYALPAPPECASVQSTPPPTVVAGPPPTTPAATLPPAGDQPADPDAARAAVNDLFVVTHTGTASPVEQRLAGHVEDYEELLPLIQQAYAAHESDVTTQTVKIYEIRFVSPTRAAVQFQNFILGPDIVQVQYAVLIDGQWKIARESECAALARAGVHCPEGP